jgi:hypothetical protein
MEVTTKMIETNVAILTMKEAKILNELIEIDIEGMYESEDIDSDFYETYIQYYCNDAIERCKSHREKKSTMNEALSYFNISGMLEYEIDYMKEHSPEEKTAIRILEAIFEKNVTMFKVA